MFRYIHVKVIPVISDFVKIDFIREHSNM